MQLSRHQLFKSGLTTCLLLLLFSRPIFAGPVSEFGRLRAQGNQIVGRDGSPVSVAGNSFFWSQWGGRFFNADTLNWLVKDWKTQIVRAPLGVWSDGYLAHPEAETARVCAVVDAAIAADIYVLIDWHSHEAHKQTDLAIGFFTAMAKKYGRDPHLIYEIYNEPTMNVSWSADVKPYAQKVIAAIRAIDPETLIVVGTPHWSQDVDAAARDPLTEPNVAYALHFYAGTHKAWLRKKAVVALQQGLPLFVSEWGTCNADGNGPIDEPSCREWVAFMHEWHLSACNWAISDKSETASALLTSAASNGGWSDASLTPSGQLARDFIRHWNDASAEPKK